MKTKMWRKLCAVLLAVVLCMAPLLTCASAASGERNLPHIDFRGFMNDPLYADKNDAGSEKLWPPTGDKITALVKGLLPALAKFGVTKNWDSLGDSLIPALNTLLAPLACDKGGNVTNDSGAYFVYPTADEVRADKYIPFTYDWRADPFVSAAQLHALIEYLTEELGYSQVVLECHSYAGVVMLTYFSTYGTAKVKSCVFGASAVYGAGFAGGLVKGDINVNGDALLEYLGGAFDHNTYENLINTLVEMLASAGVVTTLSDFVNGLFANLGDRLYKESILPVLGCWLSVWSMVPDADLAAGLYHVFDELCAENKAEYAPLLARVEQYNTVVRSHREQQLQTINENCGVYVFSHYGYAGLPISNDWQTMSDGVLQSSATSFGGSFKAVDTDEIFIPGANVSPDGKVNGATALFPDQTWYLRDCKHGLKNDSLSEMAKVLLYSDGQATVNTYSEYPQFMQFDDAAAGLVVDTGAQPEELPDDAPTSVLFFEKVKLFFADIIKLIVSLFRKAFSK